MARFYEDGNGIQILKNGNVYMPTKITHIPIFNPSRTQFGLLDANSGEEILELTEITEIGKRGNTKYANYDELLTENLDFFVSALGGGGGSIIIPDKFRFATTSARDSYFNPNELNLLVPGLQIFVADDGTGDPVIQRWLNITPATTADYDNTNWVNLSAGLTGSQVKLLYENNPDTNDFNDADDALVKSLSNVSTNTIPLKGSTTYGNSALSETATEVVSTKTLRVPPGTVRIGQNAELSNALRSLNIHDPILSRRGLLLTQLYDDSGSQDAFVYDIAAISNLSINSGTGETEDTAQFIQTTTNDEIIRTIRVTTTQISTSTPIEIIGRIQSHTGAEVFRINENVTTNASGIAEVSLSNPIITDANFDLYLTINLTGMSGSQVSGTFVPNSEVDIQVITRPIIATQSHVATEIATKEDGLGNPTSDGQILSSTTAGVRSWVNDNTNDTDAIHDNVSGEISSISNKANPVGTDYLLIEDSADSNNKKHVLISSLPSTGSDADAIHDNVADEINQITEKTTISDDDLILIEDSADSNNKKKVTVSTLTGGQSYHTPSLQNLSVDIQSRVDIGTNLNVSHIFTWDAHNSANLSTLLIQVVSGTNQTITLPIHDGSNSLTTTLSGIDTSSSGTVTFQLRGTDTRGNEVTSNLVTITIANVSAHANYMAITNDNLATSVDIGTAQNSADLNPSFTIPTFTGNSYIQILQTMTNSEFTFINIGGLNQKGGFTINENARTIGGQAYRQYVTTNLITTALIGQTITTGGSV